jgi:hypothetical protein
MDGEPGFVDPEIQPYVDIFLNEAHTRGLAFNTTFVKIYFGTTASRNSAETFMKSNRIVIDRSGPGWTNYPEALVLHELGHLLLHREHDDRSLNAFAFKSIMVSRGPARFSGKYAYRWPYYIEELFDPNTPKPDWATIDDRTEEIPL